MANAMRDGRWKYTIRIYAPRNTGGALLLETVHATESSKNTEIEVVRTRMSRGEVGRAEIISHVEPFGIVELIAGKG